MDDLKISYRDIRRHPLVDKVSYPGTHDKDRYARELRRIIRIMHVSVKGSTTSAGADPIDALWDAVLTKLLFDVSRNDTIETNQLRVIEALDTVALFSDGAVVWRGGQCTCTEDMYNPVCTAARHQ